MGKLGKRARKFSRKNLPSVLKNRRKYKARLYSFKRRSSAAAAPEKIKCLFTSPTSGILDEENQMAGYNFLDARVSDDEEHLTLDLSDSDGYLSEDSDCPYISEGDDDHVYGDEYLTSSMGQHNAIYLKLQEQKDKLEMLNKKDPNFLKFLEDHEDAIKKLSTEELNSEEEDASETIWDSGGSTCPPKRKVITGVTVDVWCWLIIEEQNITALSSLLNGYRTACHYCADGEEASHLKIASREVFSKILIFVLYEADDIFRRILGISYSYSKDNILELKNNSRWGNTRPMIKSYLRSTLFLLNQITDAQIIMFTLSRIRASIIFFAAFPSLTSRLIKTAVHFWASGDEALSSSSFVLIREMSMNLSSECYQSFLAKTYQAYLKCVNFVEPENLKHVKFLGDCIVELYSLDVQNSCAKVLASLQQLAAILQQAFSAKKKEALRTICSWKFTKIFELWVYFIGKNMSENEIKPLLYVVILIARAVPQLFPGLRYIPLRLRYIKLLNQLSSCSGVFIPVAYMLLDSFDTKVCIRSDSKAERSISLFNILKAPKQWLKSLNFHQACIYHAIELLCEHFSQWSNHVSFPDLVAIPLILVKRCHDSETRESIRRMLKRFIDQVQAHAEYVQRRRDEVSFSPGNKGSTDAFFLMKKANGNVPFDMYCNDICKKAVPFAIGPFK